MPIATAAAALALNIARVRLPATLDNFIGQFAALAIPLILFAIGQNLQLLMPAARLRLVLAASFFRLVGGFALGFAVVAALRLLFNVDVLSRQVILLQAVMPTATMATFFGEYVPLDEELLSGIIAVSTLLSFVTLPLWVMVIRVPGRLSGRLTGKFHLSLQKWYTTSSGRQAADRAKGGNE